MSPNNLQTVVTNRKLTFGESSFLISTLLLLHASLFKTYTPLAIFFDLFIQASSSIDEDSFSVEKHVKLIQTEMAKSKRNDDLIRDRMNKTFKQRREEVDGGMMTTKDLSSKYSALQAGCWVRTFSCIVCCLV